MAVKTRAELKSENAADFPDNTARLISPADLRGQMDDIVDSAVFPEDGGTSAPAGDVRFVSDIPAMRALTGLAAGSVIFVGDRMDQFIGVNDATLAADGGTVFIPNSELSPVEEHQITPWSYFQDAYGTLPLDEYLFQEYQLPHTGLDFESMQWVLTDGGETLTVWDALHGHVASVGWAERTEHPQWPLVDFGTGRLRDPDGHMTATSGPSYPNNPLIRTGGVLIRYRYATSGLRLKRVIGGNTYQLRWWSPIAVDEEEEGEETDNTGRICWCLNAAAKANAAVVLIDKFYNYAGVVEIPDGIELRGKGVGLSGFRVMKDGALQELLLANSAAPLNNWKEYDYPPAIPATRSWAYEYYARSRTIGFYPATGSTRIRLVDLEWDGNIANNLGLFAKRGPSSPGSEFVPVGEDSGIYAYGYAIDNGWLYQGATWSGIACTRTQNRQINDLTLEVHNIKVHGYAHLFLGHENLNVEASGLVELGENPVGQFSYSMSGNYEHVRCFGYAAGDGIRTEKFTCRTLEFLLSPPPDVMFSVGPYPTKHPSDPDGIGVDGGNPYHNVAPQLINGGGFGYQRQNLAANNPWPQLNKFRIDIDNLFIDASALDDYPAGETFWPFGGVTTLGADNIRIGSGKIRLGLVATTNPVLFSGPANSTLGHVYRNNVIENLIVEYGARLHPVFLGNWFASQAQFRNITFEPRGSTRLVNDPGAGSNILLGSLFCSERVPQEHPQTEFYDGGRRIDFSQTTAAMLGGKWIDITPTDPAPATPPMFRIWFNYNAGSTPPSGTGVTLIAVALVTADTTSTTTAKFSAAIEANASVNSYLTAATFGTQSVIGSWSHWNDPAGGFPTFDLSHAYDTATHTGITYKGEVKNDEQLARHNATAVTNDAWLVVENNPATYPLPASHLWKWNGSTWIDAGVFSGIIGQMRASRRNYEPAVVNFERFVAADPVYAFLLQMRSVGPDRDVTVNLKECVLGAATASYITDQSNAGYFISPTVLEIRDRVHFNFEDTVFDIRDNLGYFSNLDLLLYAGRFRGCRVRTPTVATGLTTMGAGYEMLVSEQSGVFTITPGAGVTTVDIQTKLFWVPKDGNVRIYPANPATAVVWNSNMPSVEWRKSARPVGGTPTALTGGYYTQDEDRRAPVLRLTFATAPATALAIGWSAAVSP